MDSVQTLSQGFSGTVEYVKLMDLIQLACLAKMNHDIRVASRSRSGSIRVRGGQVRHAETGDLRGDEALVEMLVWQYGRFRALPAIPDEQEIVSITKGWEFLIIEAMRLQSSRSGTESSGAETAQSHAQEEAFREFTGEMQGIQLADLVQLLCFAGKGFKIQLQSDKGEGSIWMRSGNILHAVCGELQGEEAFFRMFGWQGGRFETLLPQEEGEPASIDKPYEHLLMEAVRQQDEASGGETGEKKDEEATSLQQRILGMKISQKIRVAMTGDKEVRNLLIRDANRIVQFAIISNPRITESEVAVIAYSRNVDEDVLRRIAGNREWVKLYPIRLALATNPKTPLPIATKLVPTLLQKDMKQLARSRTVPTAVAQVARRLLADKE